MLKHPFPFLKETYNNNRGISIVEVMVAAGLATIISLGVATMMQDMFIERKRIMLMATLRDLKTKIESNIRDNGSWAKTMAANSGTLGCLINNTVCTAVYTPGANPPKIILRDTADQVAFDLLDWASAGANGFTEGGAPCNTFSATAGGGNDNCPISYRLVANMWCPGAAATCTNPQLKISGRLIYNPSTTGVLNRFRGVINTGDLTSTADGPTVAGKYDVNVKRSAVDTNVTFRYALKKAGGGSAPGIGNCPVEGAGTCNVGAMAIHPLANWTRVSDTESLVTASGQTLTINANQGGPYHCTITVPAFATMGFTADLYNATDGVVVASASTVAGLWSQTAAVIDVNFVAASGKSFIVRQKCQALPGNGANNCTLGMASDPYTPGVANEQEIVTFNCVRLDKSL